MKYVLTLMLLCLACFSRTETYARDFQKEFNKRGKKVLAQRSVSAGVSVYVDCVHCMRSAKPYGVLIYNKKGQNFVEIYVLDKIADKVHDTTYILDEKRGEQLFTYVGANLDSLTQYEYLFYSQDYMQKVDTIIKDGVATYRVSNANQYNFGPYLQLKTKILKKKLSFGFMVDSDMYYMQEVYPKLGELLLILSNMYFREMPYGKLELMHSLLK